MPGLAHLDHFKIFFADTAIGALPISRDIFPAGACHDALVRPAFSLVIDESAYNTLPLLHAVILEKVEKSYTDTTGIASIRQGASPCGPPPFMLTLRLHKLLCDDALP